jgi:hypothetical protein
MRNTVASSVAALVLCGGCGSSGAPAPASAPAPAGAATVSAPANQTRTQTRMVMIGDSFSPQTGPEAINAFVPDVVVEEKGGECSLTRTGGSGATTVSAWFPARATANLQVSMTFDSAQHLVRYSERRGIATIQSTVGMTDAQRDSVLRASTLAVRSTMISFDWVIDQALVTNRGGGKPTNAILGSVRAIEKLDKLGPPVARLERVRKLCGV